MIEPLKQHEHDHDPAASCRPSSARSRARTNHDPIRFRGPGTLVPALRVEVGAADGAARGERAHGLAAVGASAPIRHHAQDGARSGDPELNDRPWLIDARVLITSEFLTDYEPPDLGADANFFVVARTEGFGEEERAKRETAASVDGGRLDRGPHAGHRQRRARGRLGAAADRRRRRRLEPVAAGARPDVRGRPVRPRRGEPRRPARASGSCSTSSPTGRSSRPPTRSSPTTRRARGTGARS